MILDQIVSDKKRRLPEHKRRIPEQEMRKLAEAMRAAIMILRERLREMSFPSSESSKRRPQVSVKLKARLTYWIELRNTMLLWMRSPA